MFKSIKTILLVFIFQYVNGQVRLNGVKIDFQNRGSQTDFVVSTDFGGLFSVENAWLGFGLNLIQSMTGTSVVLCRNLQGSTSVQQYYNNRLPKLMDSTNPTLGLSNSSVSSDQGMFTCKFTRDNSNANPNYFNINKQSPYIVVAFGSGDIKYHGPNRFFTDDTVIFPINLTTVRPITTTVRPITTTVRPITTTVRPITTTVRPITTTVRPITTTVRTTTSTVRPTTRTSTVRPTTRTSTVRPTRRTSTVRPTTRTSTVRPTKRTSTVVLLDENWYY